MPCMEDSAGAAMPTNWNTYSNSNNMECSGGGDDDDDDDDGRITLL